MKLIDCASVRAPTIHSDVFISQLFFFRVELVLNVNVFLCALCIPATHAPVCHIDLFVLLYSCFLFSDDGLFCRHVFHNSRQI